MLQKSEPSAPSHIHISNFGQKKELSWLPEEDSSHIEKMLYERWKPQWQAAKGNEQFRATFGEYIHLVEAVANTISEDLQYVIKDESSQTLIHNDLNPGNVLIHNNTVYINEVCKRLNENATWYLNDYDSLEAREQFGCRGIGMGNFFDLEQPVGKQYSFGKGTEFTSELEQIKAENRFQRGRLTKPTSRGGFSFSFRLIEQNSMFGCLGRFGLRNSDIRSWEFEAYGPEQ
ncbi:aminoglycoside phosphotransferase/kinase family protein [Paenibacillus lautus]|uniref:hypothetical protein n=1 Tax=Paenibacillus lautus TaxID=1401 RepID=UPI002DBEE3DF|nr:hypothetical protein [Paenibacillus lautus]MEC0260228.1 hypothetical protein [Paenibacillus lautus]